MAKKIYNFSAGPAMLPSEVLKNVQRDFLNWQETGMSVVEMSHRGSEFVSIAGKAEALLRELMDISDDYHVLFLQGGATLQFSAIPMNLLRGKGKAAYINTGSWSVKAIKAAGKYCEVDVVASSEDQNFTTAPDLNNLELTDEHAYLHYTPNETIGGVRIFDIPDSGGIPLVGDFSSMILSEPIDVSKFGLIYAGAQKNIGPAGLTIVIVRKDLCGDVLDITPDMLHYEKLAEKDSMLNTPATFAWYVAGEVFEWIKELGGLAAMQEHNQKKAKLLYDTIEESPFYSSPVNASYRSLMNVPFMLKDDSLNDAFLTGAKERGLLTLKGHRSVGGMRASIYNAMPMEGVQALVDFMKEFEKSHTT